MNLIVTWLTLSLKHLCRPHCDADLEESRK